MSTLRTRLRPDPALVARLLGSGGEDLRKCMQCATCSSVCEVLDGDQPGPRKEMLWAQWGLRDRLMADPNPWLCHQCGDCTQRCPRGARPSDVMAAIRRAHIVHHAWPSAFGRWANVSTAWLWLVVAAAVLLACASALWPSIGEAGLGDRIVFPFWTRMPHGFLATVFGALLLFDGIVLFHGVRRFWRAMAGDNRLDKPIGPSLRAALARILFHDDFAACSTSRARRTHHLLVVFGILALGLTSLWALTARWNPLGHGVVYPFGLWTPWKLLANAGGLALLLGSSLMLWERVRRPQTAGATRGPDWILLALLLLIGLSGFASEALHVLRIEPLRHVVYLGHLSLVVALLVLLPYSKLAHLVYRTVAMTYAEHTREAKR